MGGGGRAGGVIRKERFLTGGDVYLPVSIMGGGCPAAAEKSGVADCCQRRIHRERSWNNVLLVDSRTSLVHMGWYYPPHRQMKHSLVVICFFRLCCGSYLCMSAPTTPLSHACCARYGCTAADFATNH